MDKYLCNCRYFWCCYQLPDRYRYCNLYPAIVDRGQEVVFYGTPGISEYLTINTVPIRGMHVCNNILYVVAGPYLYKVDTFDIVTYLGTGFLTALGSVIMCDNGVEVMITDGAHGYVYNIAANTFNVIGDIDFVAPGSCTFLDGSILVNQVGTSNVYASDPYDASSWDGLNYGVAQLASGLTKRLYAQYGNLYVFNEHTTEVWYNTGSAGFPFAPNIGMTINAGIAAPFSVAATGDVGGTLLWLAATREGQGFVIRVDGGAPTTVTSPEIEKLWSDYPVISDAIAYGFRMEGHSFYVLSFPTADKTWVYDLTTQAWHEWSTGITGGKHASEQYAYFNGKHIVSGGTSGKLYQMAMDIYTDDGEVIRRTLTMPHLGGDDRKTRYDSLELVMESGASESDYEESIIMDMSNDHGHTYGNSHDVSIGAAGEHRSRVIWRRLGCSFYRTFRVTLTAVCKVVIRYAFIKTS